MSRLHTEAGGLPWLVLARNEIQSLMLRLHQRWEGLGDAATRQWAVGAAFALWRAVFLIYAGDTERSLYDVDVTDAAQKYLLKIIETNSITFENDRTYKSWSGGFYVNDAVFRVRQMAGDAAIPPERLRTLRGAWTAAFDVLDGIVSGTISGTPATVLPTKRKRKRR